MWRIVLAYAVLAGVAVAAIYVVDLKVMRHQSQPTGHPVVRD